MTFDYQLTLKKIFNNNFQLIQRITIIAPAIFHILF